MAKFYIQSGNLSLVVVAQDAEGAALWAMNDSINKFLPIEGVEERLLTDETLYGILNGLAQLDPQIAVSQIGFGRSEAGLFETDRLFDTWRSLARSIDYLFDQLG